MEDKDPERFANKLMAALIKDPVFMNPRDSVSSLSPSPTPKAVSQGRAGAVRN